MNKNTHISLNLLHIYLWPFLWAPVWFLFVCHLWEYLERRSNLLSYLPYQGLLWSRHIAGCCTTECFDIEVEALQNLKVDFHAQSGKIINLSANWCCFEVVGQPKQHIQFQGTSWKPPLLWLPLFLWMFGIIHVLEDFLQKIHQ